MSISSKSKPKWILGVDTEDDGKGNPYLFAAVSGEGSRLFDTRQKTLDYLRDKGRELKGKAEVQVWCTNLEYDLVNLYGHERIAELQLFFGRSALVGAKWRGENVHFRDTVRHVPVSVEEWGKLVGLEKVNKDMRPEHMAERCARDAAITYRAAQKLREIYRTFGEEPRMTLASTAYHIWQRQFFKQRVISPPREVWEISRGAYHGGRTEAFALGQFSPIKVIDAASMFPWAMVAAPYPLPWGTWTRARPGERPDANGFYRALIEVPDGIIPPLPVRTNDGTVYPCGSFVGEYVGAELLHAGAVGCRVKILSGIVFHPPLVQPFSEYVGAMFKRKSRARGARRLIYKTLLNSLLRKIRSAGREGQGDPGRNVRQALQSRPQFPSVVWARIFQREGGAPALGK